MYMKANIFKTFFVGILMFGVGAPQLATANRASAKKEESKQTLADLEGLLNNSFTSFNSHKKQEKLFTDLKKGGLEISSQGQKFLWNDLKSPAPTVKVEDSKMIFYFADGANSTKAVEIRVDDSGKEPILWVNDKKFAGNDLKSMSNLRAAMVKSFVVNQEKSAFNFLNFILPMAHAGDDNKENWFTNNLGWILMGAGAVVGIWTKSWQWGLGLAGAGALWMLARTAQDNNPGSKPTGGYKSDDLPTEH